MSTPLGQTTTTTRTSYRTVNVSTDPAADSVFPANPVTYRTVNVSAEPQHVGPVTYRTVNLSPEPAAGSVRSVSPVTYRTVNQVSAEPQHMAYRTVNQVSPLPYVNGSYENVRYLVPVQQQQQQFVMVPQMMQQMHQMSPLYLQTLPRVSVSSSQEEGDVLTRQIRVESTSGTSSVFSQSSSPIKSPEPSVEEEVEVDAVQEEEEEEEEEEEQEEEDEVEVEVEEVEIINVIEQKPSVIQRVSRVEVRSEEVPQIMKMDTRFFGELLAEVYRKNCDIHSCISEHVAKIRGRKHQLDPSNDYKVEKDEVEYLLPKGASELTKQQIRYLLQTRLTADKSMRLLLSTFSSLREELIHMSEDLRRLESEKEGLERDLSFKSDQAQQYDRLLEAVRENNRQLQASLKDSAASQRTLENQLMSSRSSDSNRDFKMKELEGRMRALEKENEMLRQKSAGQFSSSTLQTKTEELSRQYNQQLSSMREEKDRELQILRSQLTRVQTEVTTDRSSSDKSLQLRISELLSMLEKRQTIITRQEEEIRKLQQERNDNSKSMTTTTITKRYRNKYPILGLLSDDYQASSRIKDAKTIVIEKTGDMIKQE